MIFENEFNDLHKAFDSFLLLLKRKVFVPMKVPKYGLEGVWIGDPDYDAVAALIIYPRCLICPVHQRKKDGTKCEGCNLTHHSKISEGVYDVAIKLGSIRKMGARKLNASELGLAHAVLFSHYIRFGFKWPGRIEVNIFNNLVTSGNPRWMVHHINGNHYDFRLENLVLILVSEHKPLHTRLNEAVENADVEALNEYFKLTDDLKYRMNTLPVKPV